MPNAIKIAAKRKGITGYDALADELIEHDRTAFGGKSARYLGKMIGELDRHDARRWRKHPAALQCLLDFLDLSVGDLELHRTASQLLFEPVAFPDLPPLSLVDGKIWTIGEALMSVDHATAQPQSRYEIRKTLDYWLRPGLHGSEPLQPQWLWVSDATEFDLLTRKLDAVSHHRVLHKESARAAWEEHRDDLHYHRPLILLLTETQSPSDLEVLLQHRQRAPLLIISPWNVPPREETPSSQPGTDPPVLLPWFELWQWVLLAGWKGRLLHWIDAHFREKDGKDTLFSGEDVLRLLDQLDPGGRLFTSVEDVLRLAQAVYKSDNTVVGGSLKPRGQSGDWLERLAGPNDVEQDLLLTLVEARWNSWDLPWRGSLYESDWANLVRHAPFEILKVHALARGDGGYDFKSPLRARLILREYLIRQLTLGNSAAWLPACFDGQRQDMLDAALDALSSSQLEQVAQRLGPRLAQLDHAGAAETLFAAAGRRLIQGMKIGDRLAGLLNIVVPRLRRVEDSYLPLSRSMEAPAAQVDWVSVCWAWSLRSAAPESFEPSWQFPGWHKELPARLPRFLTSYGSSHSIYSWEREPQSMRNFLIVAEKWVVSSNAALQYEQEPPALICARLLHATKRGNPIDPSWWYSVIGNPGAEQALLDSVRKRGGPPYYQTASRWWPALVAFRRQEADMGPWRGQMSPNSFSQDPTHLRFSVLLYWVMDRLAGRAEDALSLLGEQELVWLRQRSDLLPVPFRKALLRRLACQPSLALFDFEVPGFLLKFGPEIGRDVALFLDHHQLGRYAADCLWKWEARHAASLLKGPVSSAGALNLFMTAPPNALGEALAALAILPKLLAPDDLADWARLRLPDARRHAPELLKLVLG